MGTFYLSDWSNSGDTLADFSAVDAIGCWTAHRSMGASTTPPQQSSQRRSWQDTATPWDRESGRRASAGYIAAGTRREALQQLAFAKLSTVM